MAPGIAPAGIAGITQMHWRSTLFPFLLLTMIWGSACAEPGTIRDQEIAECRSGEIVTWNDGTDRRAIHPSLRFAYRHENAPPWFSLGAVQEMVGRAAAEWGKCGIPVALLPAGEADLRQAGTVLVQWN